MALTGKTTIGMGPRGGYIIAIDKHGNPIYSSESHKLQEDSKIRIISNEKNGISVFQHGKDEYIVTTHPGQASRLNCRVHEKFNNKEEALKNAEMKRNKLGNISKSNGVEKMDQEKDIQKEMEQICEHIEYVHNQSKEDVKQCILLVGPEIVKKSLANMSEEESEIIKSIIQEMIDLKKAVNDYPTPDKEEAPSAKQNIVKLADSKMQEETANIEEDEKLVKEKNKEINHQGDHSPEGLENPVIKADKVCMDKKEFKDEHKKLVSTLKEGSEEEQKKEAEKQDKELKEYVKKGGDGSGRKGHITNEESPHKEIEMKLKAISERVQNHKKFLEDSKKRLDAEIAEIERLKKERQEKLINKSEVLEEVKEGKEVLEKKAPKGIDPEKHESCVKEVKKEGHDVGSAHAICTSSMKKSIDWRAENALLKANILGRNYHFNVNEYLDLLDDLNKSKKINEVEKEGDVNDTIAKGLDISYDQYQKTLIEKSSKPSNIDLKKSFSDDELRESLNLTEEEFLKLLGE